MEPTLLGDLAAEPIDQEIDGLLLTFPRPSSSDVANFLKLYPAGTVRLEAARALISRGVAANTVSAALQFLDATAPLKLNALGGILAIVSAAASGYHGYRRNQSIGWGAAWFILGGIFPIFTPVVALAQGFGQSRKGA